MIENVIKKSKFIGYAFNVYEESEILKILNNIKEEHKKATHITYAYVLTNTAKCCDDGEPSGTAGLPILNVINKNNLKNVLIVVVRYFGGIKLGAGGLVRAYSGTASLALKNTELRQLEECLKIEFEIDFKNLKLIETLSQYNYIKNIKTTFGENVVVEIVILKEKSKEFENMIQNMFNNATNIKSQQEIMY